MEHFATLQSLVDRLALSGDRLGVLALQADGISRWSYADLGAHVSHLANGLVAAGLAQGEHVVLLASNRPEWIIACLAVLRAGAVIIPLDTQIAQDALRHVLQDSEARWIFTTTDYLNRLSRLELDVAVHSVLLDVEPRDPRSWHALLTSEAATFPVVTPDDMAALFYTSGTTGIPKGVPLTHRNIVFEIEAVLATGLLQADDILLQPLPMYHVYPFTVGTLLPLAAGCPFILPQSLTGQHLFRAMQEAKPTILIGVPRLYRAITSRIDSQVQAQGELTAKLFRSNLKFSIWLRRRFGIRVGKILFRALHKRLGAPLRLLTSGGSALDPELGWLLEGLGWKVAIGYGLTETAPILTMNLPNGGIPRPESVGKPVPGVDLRIDTHVQREEEEPNSPAPMARATDANREEGEILARGPNVFSGYRNLPEQTAEVFTPDGWFRTGDLGYFEDGYLTITGRASTMIVTEGGKNVQPEPVEEIYQEHPFIREIGILQHENKLVALIVPDMDGVNRSHNGDVSRAVREAVSEQAKKVASYQRISDYAISQEPLPRTNLGKIRRHLLRESYIQIKQGIVKATKAVVGPLPIEDMSERDRALLEHPVARQVWDWFANRYAEVALTPDTNPQLDLGLDSLAWLNLSIEISQQTGVELSDDAIRRITTIRDLLQEVTTIAAQGTPVVPVSLLEEPEAVLTEAEKRWISPMPPTLRMASVLLYAANRALMGGYFQVEARGLEHLPTQGESGFVLTPNHTSYIDAFVVAAALPYRYLRQTYWAGSVDEAFGNVFFRLGSRMAQVMPVAGERAIMSKSSLAFAASTLKRKRNLIWFPEGRVSKDGTLMPFRQGLGLVLNRYPTLVVPVVIRGTYEALPWGTKLPRPVKVTVTFNKPLDSRDLLQQGTGEQPPSRIVQALHEHMKHLIEEQEKDVS